MTEPVSVRQFAKLDGCSHTLVQKAVIQGKLPVTEDGRIDPALAGTGWRRQNRRGNPGGNTEKVATEVATGGNKRPAAPAEPITASELAELGDDDVVAAILAGRFLSQGEAERVRENSIAAKNLLVARREAGDVVDIEVAEAVLFEQARQSRDGWSNWPVRVGPLVAAELGASVDLVIEVLVKHVQQHLQDLGEPEADFTGE